MYDTMDDAWFATVDDLIYGGDRIDSRDGGCVELIGFDVRLSDVAFPLPTVGRRASVTYAAAEFLWYWSGASDVQMIAAYAPQYARFAQPETGRAHGAYGARLERALAFVQARSDVGPFPWASQLDAAVDLICKTRDTRQALVGLWDAGDLVYANTGKTRDIPCTVCLQYLPRGEYLHAVTYMRSNDVWLGMPYDVFTFTLLQRVVAARCHLKPGRYAHHVGSMHLYDRNREAADAARLRSEGMADELPLDLPIGDLEAAVEFEADARNGLFVPQRDLESDCGKNTLAYELAARCCRKWDKTDAVCNTPLFRRYYE